MPFNMFPYSNLHSLNLDWILRIIKQLKISVQELAADVATVVRVTPQMFTSAEKQQARTNIGAAAASDIPDVSDVVRTSEQTLTTEEQDQARVNINAADLDTVHGLSRRVTTLSDTTVHTTEQELTVTQKQQARTNIGAAAASDIPDVSDVVRTSVQSLDATQRRTVASNIHSVSYDTQELTNAQKGIARQNIDAVSPEQAATAATSAISAAHLVSYDEQVISTGDQLQARLNIDAEEKPFEFLVYKNELDNWTVEGDFTEFRLSGKNAVIIFDNGTNRIVIPAYVTTSGGAISSVVGEVAFLSDPSLVEPNDITSIYISGSGSNLSVTISDYQQRQVPVPIPFTDTGKVLVARNNGTVGWQDKGPFVVTISGSTWTGADWSTIVNNLTMLIVIFPNGHKVIPLTYVPGNTPADEFLYCRDFQTSTIYRVYGNGQVTQS